MGTGFQLALTDCWLEKSSDWATAPKYAESIFPDPTNADGRMIVIEIATVDNIAEQAGDGLQRKRTTRYQLDILHIGIKRACVCAPNISGDRPAATATAVATAPLWKLIFRF